MMRANGHKLFSVNTVTNADCGLHQVAFTSTASDHPNDTPGSNNLFPHAHFKQPSSSSALNLRNASHLHTDAHPNEARGSSGAVGALRPFPAPVFSHPENTSTAPNSTGSTTTEAAVLLSNTPRSVPGNKNVSATAMAEPEPAVPSAGASGRTSCSSGAAVPGVTATGGGINKRKARAGPRSRSSPFIGVSQVKAGKYKNTCRWEAHIWDSSAEGGSGRQLHLGSFVSAEQAAKAYDRIAILLRGRKTDLNQPFEMYEDDPELSILRKLSKREQVLAIRKLQEDPLPMKPRNTSEPPSTGLPTIKEETLQEEIKSGEQPASTPTPTPPTDTVMTTTFSSAGSAATGVHRPAYTVQYPIMVEDPSSASPALIAVPSVREAPDVCLWDVHGAVQSSGVICTSALVLPIPAPPAFTLSPPASPPHHYVAPSPGGPCCLDVPLFSPSGWLKFQATQSSCMPSSPCATYLPPSSPWPTLMTPERWQSQPRQQINFDTLMQSPPADPANALRQGSVQHRSPIPVNGYGTTAPSASSGGAVNAWAQHTTSMDGHGSGLSWGLVGGMNPHVNSNGVRELQQGLAPVGHGGGGGHPLLHEMGVRREDQQHRAMPAMMRDARQHEHQYPSYMDRQYMDRSLSRVHNVKYPAPPCFTD